MVKTGYKQTEIGVIPEDWSPKIVDDVMKFSGGSQPPLYTFSLTKKKGYVRLIQIRDYKTDKYKVYIPESLGRKFCTKDEIMIGRYGPPIFQIRKGIEGAYNVALLKAIPNEELINKTFAWHFLKSEVLFNFVDKLSQRSSGQTGVDLVELRNYPIPLPPLAEQEAIAEALSDADAWIESLEQLIAKKRLIKQGAMQELLTPKEDREMKKLGEVVEIKRGQIITSSIRVDGDIPVIAGGKTPAYYHNKANRKGKTITVSASGASAGYVGFHNYPIFASDCSTISESDEYIIEYIYYYLLRSQEVIYGYQTGGAQPHIHAKDIEPMLIGTPSLPEQIRIATILSDIDVELKALEKQLGKARQIKHGMMQELLTGRIRLI